MDADFQRLSQSCASDAPSAERADFIRKTYAHLAGAVGLFALLEFALFQTALPGLMLGVIEANPISWLAVMGAFALVGWIATRAAHSSASRELQYAALGGYVVAEAIVFMPILLIASLIGGATLISSAAFLTMMLVTGLTVSVFMTGADFSWMRPILCIGGFVAFGVIAASILMGFSLGLLFSGIMILFAAGAILYDTSNVLHHYRTDQYVGASLELFASVALMFWYVLRLLMSLSRR